MRAINLPTTGPLCPELDAYLVAKAPPHYAISKYAPETLADLLEWQRHYRLGVDPLPVWDGASGTSIYGSPEVNYAYRAWHDATHLRLLATTNLEDELRVSRAHFAEAKRDGLCSLGLRLLWIDSEGQNRYYARHGDFVADQREFAIACLRQGIATAIEEKH